MLASLFKLNLKILLKLEGSIKGIVKKYLSKTLREYNNISVL